MCASGSGNNHYLSSPKRELQNESKLTKTTKLDKVGIALLFLKHEEVLSDGSTPLFTSGERIRTMIDRFLCGG